MVQVSLESNIRGVLSEFERISHVSVQYAISYAINDTLFDMRRDVGNEIKSVFEHPRDPFTIAPWAWEVERAKSGALVGAIKMKPAQAAYMRYQVYGGTEMPSGGKKRAVPVPSTNGAMRADHGGLKKSWKNAFGNHRYFSGVPKQAKVGNGKVKPIPGLYRRYGKSKWNKRLQEHTGGYLKLQVSWEDSTTYSKKWDFHAYAYGFFQAQFEENFRRRMQEQLARRS